MNYTLCIDNMVLQSLHKALTCSLTYFLNETDTNKPHLESLFEVQLELDYLDELNCEIIFRPSLHHGEGLFTLVSELIRNIFAQGSLIPRVAAHLKKDNYQVSLTQKFYNKINFNHIQRFLRSFSGTGTRTKCRSRHKTCTDWKGPVNTGLKMVTMSTFMCRY